MTNQALAVPWALRALGEPRHRLPSIILAASIAALALIGTAEAKTQCSVAAGPGGYWSWRMIDDRKCWYEGKPMLSKSLLEWPADTAAPPDTKAELASAPPPDRRNPMNAQARELDDSNTFDALWRDRIEGSRR
jgi:hypothetical protein